MASYISYYHLDPKTKQASQLMQPILITQSPVKIGGKVPVEPTLIKGSSFSPF
jgi:hypothetical protein